MTSTAASFVYPASVRLALGLLTVAALLGSGCASGPTRAERMAAAAPTGPALPAMEGQQTFFAGTVQVDVTLGAGLGTRFRGGQGGGGGRPGGGAGGMEMGMRGGGGGGGGGMGGGRRGGPPDDLPPELQGGGRRSSGALGSTLPPATLRVRLTNLGKETTEVEFLEFNSELGNFAVYPAKLALAPGQSAEPEGMTSRLGVTSSEIGIVVRLRAAGQVDRQTLTLRTRPPEPAAPVTP